MNTGKSLDVTHESDAILRRWRTRALNIILTTTTVVGFLPLVITINRLIHTGEILSAVIIYPAIYIFLVVLTGLRRLDVRLRGWGFLLLGYGAAAMAFESGGLMLSGRVYLLALPVMALILIGVRSGWVAVGLSLVIYGVFTILAQGALASRNALSIITFETWITAGATLAMLLIVAIVLLQRFHRLQVTTLEAELRASADLAEANADLERRVEQRTAELSHANARLEDSYRRELEVARQIQASLLPPGAPEILGLDIAGFSQPAHQVGGDFFNYFAFDQQSIGVAVGDVSGKGIQAALMMALSVGLLVSQVRREMPPAELLRILNADLHPHTQRNKMNTALSYLTLQQTDGVWELCTANAGVVAPLLRQGDNSVEWLDVGGLPLGVLTGANYKERRQTLSPGDALILCSDGIVEAMNARQELYSFERLAARVKNAPGRSAQALQEWILSDVRDFAGGVDAHDDLTLVVIVVGGKT